ncbi:MAG TPA: NAD(P)-dependent oxidoreductase [Nitrososphaeraceae archaeon]|nr:NAD(P)-dependent oxidoreductase [Nitrososphaeraceae archaeon]
MKIGIIGLGLMGSNLCLRLIRKGFQVNVHNRNVSKSLAIEKKGAKVFNTPKEVADYSDFIITCVTNFEAVNKIYFYKNGVSETKNKNVIVSDFSTLSPKDSVYCYQKFKRKNITMMSIPVMGGPNAALTGTLIPIVAGEEISFKKIKYVLQELGDPIFYIGNKAGSASAIKLALNLNIGIIAMALSEGLLLAERYGIDPNLYLKILNCTNFKTGLSENKGPKMIKGDYSPSFYLKNMKKDLALIMEAAKEQDLSLPITGLVFQFYNYASKSIFADLDYSVIYKFVRNLQSLE